MKSALELETNVTNKIRDIVIICEEPKIEPKFNDYHVSIILFGKLLTLLHVFNKKFKIYIYDVTVN